MADKKISQLTSSTTPLTGVEEIALVQNGVTKKATVQDIVDVVGIQANNIIYVEQRFTGSASATLNGDGTITSSNTSYNAQLESAEIGNPSRPFPCLWSAKRAAVLAIDANELTFAQVVVRTGYSVTIGSPNASENGTVTPNELATAQADVMVSAANFAQASIYVLDKNIFWHFEDDTHVYNICKTYVISLIFSASLPTIDHKIKITGKGSFYWIYGAISGFTFIPQSINLNANLKIDFTFEAYAYYGHFRNWVITNCKSVYVKLARVWTRGAGFSFNVTMDWIALGLNKPFLVFDVDDFRVGNDSSREVTGFTIPQVSNLFTGSVNVLNVTGCKGRDAFIKFKKAMYSVPFGTDGVICRVTTSNSDTANGLTDHNVFMEVDYLTFWVDATFYPGRTDANYQGGFQMFNNQYSFPGGDPTLNKNNIFHFKCKKYETNSMFGSRSASHRISNTVEIYEVDEFNLYGNEFTTSSGIQVANTFEQGGAFNNKIVYKGSWTMHDKTTSFARFPGTNANGVTMIPGCVTIVMEGSFTNKSGSTVVDISNALPEQRFIFKDVILSGNDDAQNVVIKTSGTTPHNVLAQNVMANSAFSANTPAVGDTVIVYSDLNNSSYRF